MIAIGVDPGPKYHGMVIVDCFYDDRGLIRFQTISCGVNAVTIITEEAMELVRSYDYSILAIEATSGYVHEKQQEKHIFRHVGTFVKCARERGKRVVEISAEYARQILVKNTQASDKELKAALSAFVNLPMRSNNYTRNAAAVAIVALLQEPRFRTVKPV